jgi:hypothetical protein
VSHTQRTRSARSGQESEQAEPHPSRPRGSEGSSKGTHGSNSEPGPFRRRETCGPRPPSSTGTRDPGSPDNQRHRPPGGRRRKGRAFESKERGIGAVGSPMGRTRLEPKKGLRREASTRVATCAAIWCEAECGVGPSHPRTRPGAVPTKQRIQVQRPCPPGSLEFVSLGARVMWRNPYPHASMGVVTNTGHYRRGRSGSAAHLAAYHTQ